MKPQLAERIIPPHKCCICGHLWDSLDAEIEKKVLSATKVNADGPYCGMCLHLEMAERYALARGFEALEGGVKKWRVLRENGREAK